jgi:hypothetical protein
MSYGQRMMNSTWAIRRAPTRPSTCNAVVALIALRNTQEDNVVLSKHAANMSVPPARV